MNIRYASVLGVGMLATASALYLSSENNRLSERNENLRSEVFLLENEIECRDYEDWRSNIDPDFEHCPFCAPANCNFSLRK